MEYINIIFIIFLLCFSFFPLFFVFCVLFMKLMMLRVLLFLSRFLFVACCCCLDSVCFHKHPTNNNDPAKYMYIKHTRAKICEFITLCVYFFLFFYLCCFFFLLVGVFWPGNSINRSIIFCVGRSVTSSKLYAKLTGSI